MKKLFILAIILTFWGILLPVRDIMGQTLNCQLNIDASGRYLQNGPIGGTNPRWVMKGAFDVVMKFTPDGSGGWENNSYIEANWANRSAQMDAMKAAGINTIRIWHFTMGYINPAHIGSPVGEASAMQEMVSFCSLARSKGLFVLIEQWWPGYLKQGATDAYYDSGEWHDRMQNYINNFSAAGLDNILFGTGNEPDNNPNPAWIGNWTENTKRHIAGYRRLGYTGPVLCDTPGQDSQTWNNDQYGNIQASDARNGKPGNIGFQEHEYGWNQNSILPVSKAIVNGNPIYNQFPIFVTESGWSVTSGNLDDWANKCVNENLGGAVFFWWNAPASGQGPPTVNADGINLSSYGIVWRDHFWKAPGMPDGFANTGGNIAVTSVALNVQTATLAVGGTQQLIPTVSPSNASNQAVTWTSSNSSVASVNASGLITGVAAGTATITVSTNDQSKTATCAVTVSGGSGINIPSKIEAENYNSQSGTQNEPTTDVGGGQDVGYLGVGSYMNYNVNVSTAGSFKVDLRIASPNNGSQLQIKSGSTVLTTMTLPNTGGWQNWQTVTTPSFNLPAGVQTLQVYVSVSGFNINWMQFNSIANVPVTGISVNTTSLSLAIGASATLTATVVPSNATNQNYAWSSNNQTVATVSPTGIVVASSVGTAIITATTADGNKTSTSTITVTSSTGGGTAIPAKIEAENYNSQSGTQNEPTTDVGGGQDVGYLGVGSYMNYNVNVSTAGSFTADLRIASPNDGSQLQIKSGSTVLTTMTLPNTGGWQNWQTVTTPSFNLPAGAQTLQVYVSVSGFNINWLQFNSAGSVPAKLSGTPFGTAPAWSTGSEFDKAFDGNTATFFDYLNSDGGYTGIDLGTGGATVSKIKFYPRAGSESRMNGGKFQGSNTSSTAGFTDIFTITATPATTWVTLDVSTVSYRYLRYLSPNGGFGNVAEIEFYGIKGSSGARLGTNDNMKLMLKEEPRNKVEGEEVQIFPVPATGILNVKFKNSGSQNVHISLRDVLGKIILNTTFNANEGNNIYTIDILTIPPGIYFLSLDGEKISTIKKIVIN